MESSTFGFECVALMMTQDMVLLMGYNLIMMGFPINGEANVFSGNVEVWKGDRWPEATINNKHVFIHFHCVHSTVASNVICVGFVRVKNKLADCLKILCQG